MNNLIKLIFSFILLILFFSIIIIYFFFLNINEEKIINNVQKNLSVQIKKNKETKIDIFPSINIVTYYDIFN